MDNGVIHLAGAFVVIEGERVVVAEAVQGRFVANASSRRLQCTLHLMTAPFVKVGANIARPTRHGYCHQRTTSVGLKAKLTVSWNQRHFEASASASVRVASTTSDICGEIGTGRCADVNFPKPSRTDSRTGSS